MKLSFMIKLNIKNGTSFWYKKIQFELGGGCGM